MNKFTKKKLIAAAGGLAIAVLLASGTTSAQAGTEVYLDGAKLETKKEVLNLNGRTMMAFRDYFNAVGLDVKWDNDTRTATTTVGEKTLDIMPDQKLVKVNGVVAPIDTPPQLVKGHIYLPLRFFSETIGYQVDYQQNQGNGVVRLSNKGQQSVPSIDTVQVKNQAATSIEDGFYIQGKQLRNLQLNQGKLVVKRLDVATGQIVQQQDFFLGGGATGVEHVGFYDKEIFFKAKTKPASDYVGIAKPRFAKPETVVKTALGDVDVYEASGTNALHVIGHKGIVQVGDKVDGPTLDVSKFALPSEYARLDDGNSIFLIGDRLLSVSKAPYTLLGQWPTDGKHILSLGNKVLVYGISGNELGIGMLDATGETLPFKTVTSLNEPNMNIYDFSNAENGVRILFGSVNQRYVAKISIHTGHTSVETLPKGIAFEKLMPDLDTLNTYPLAVDSNNIIYTRNPIQ